MRCEAKSARVVVMPAVHVTPIANSSVPETRPFMPRDNDKNTDPRGRRDRPSGGKGRSGAARGPEKKFAKRGFAGKGEGDKRPYAGKREGAPPRRDYEDAPRPARFNRDDRPRGDRPEPRKDFRPRDDRGGEKRPYTPRGDARPASRFADKKFGDKRPYTPREGGGEKRPYTPRGEGFRKDGDRPRGERPYSARPPRDGDRPRGDRPERKFGGDKKFSRGAPDRGPRKDFGGRPDRGKEFGAERGDSKPWQKRDAGARNSAKPRYDRPREERGGAERPRFSRPREDRPQGDRPFRERSKFERPREDRPRRDNEDDSKIFAKRPAFGGRGAYSERTPDERRLPRPPREKKSGERIAKAVRSGERRVGK